MGLSSGKGDHRHACHGKGKMLDNRNECLKIGSNGSNQSDICRKTKNTTSKYVGVSWYRQKFRAFITINTIQYRLGYFTTERLASKAYNYINAKRDQIEALKTRQEQLEFVKKRKDEFTWLDIQY